MPNTKQNTLYFSVLLIGFALLFLLNLSVGSVMIPFKEVFNSLIGNNVSKPTWEYIILNYRLPKSITAIIAGMGLSACGLLMQTLFRNPLAGPDVLGLSSGAGLGVAAVILGASLLPSVANPILLSPYGIAIASCAGSFLVLLAILYVSNRFRNTMSVLIIGLMFSSFSSSIVSVLTYFSTAEQLQKFTFWSLGNLGSLSWVSIGILAATSGIGLLLSIFSIKSLNTLLLGENYAKSLGLNISSTRLLIILASSILAGSITAFVGPIAFVGLIVPHIAKLTFQTGNHMVLFWGTVLIGAVIMLFCDTVSQMPGFEFTLPINAITSIIGAPVVIWLIARRRGFV